MDVTNQDRIIRTTQRQQQGSVSVLVGGQTRTVPVTLTIIETYWESGRKDCTVKVPKLETKSKENYGTKEN